jgi:Lipoprotein signal peptidase
VNPTGGRARAWRLALALCGVVVAVDQGSKAAIQSALVPGERVSVFPGLHLTDIHNRGIAFGLAGGGGALLIVLTLAALGLILVLFARNATRPGLWVPVGLLAGGAFGNLADRVRIDSVTDWIDFPLWPAFNIADVMIILGVAGLAFVFMEEPSEREA